MRSFNALISTVSIILKFKIIISCKNLYVSYQNRFQFCKPFLASASRYEMLKFWIHQNYSIRPQMLNFNPLKKVKSAFKVLQKNQAIWRQPVYLRYLISRYFLYFFVVTISLLRNRIYKLWIQKSNNVKRILSICLVQTYENPSIKQAPYK